MTATPEQPALKPEMPLSEPEQCAAHIYKLLRQGYGNKIFMTTAVPMEVFTVFSNGKRDIIGYGATYLEALKLILDQLEGIPNPEERWGLSLGALTRMKTAIDYYEFRAHRAPIVG